MAGKIKKPLIGRVKNPLEAVGEYGDPTGITKGVATSLIEDLGKGGAGDFLDFIGLGGSNSESSAEKNGASKSTEIDIVNFTKKQSSEIQKFDEKSKKTEARVEAAIDYHRGIVRTSEYASSKEMQQVSTQVEQIKAELIQLSKSAKSLQLEIASVTVEQVTKSVGVYHAHFFEWMLNMLRAARERVETSEAWMNTQKSKMGKKGYWGMFKKHGTQFGLSNERAVATQVG